MHPHEFPFPDVASRSHLPGRADVASHGRSHPVHGKWPGVLPGVLPVNSADRRLAFELRTSTVPGRVAGAFHRAGTEVRYVLAVNADTVRLFLHVLAATIWVGGQITLAALVPVLRRMGTEIPAAAARRFNQVSWPAFIVLILTGVWNVIAVRSRISGSYENTL